MEKQNKKTKKQKTRSTALNPLPPFPPPSSHPLRSQAAVSEMKTELNSELTDVRAELQYNLNTACSGEKEVATAMADLQSSLQIVKYDAHADKIKK